MILEKIKLLKKKKTYQSHVKSHLTYNRAMLYPVFEYRRYSPNILDFYTLQHVNSNFLPVSTASRVSRSKFHCISCMDM